MGMLLTNYEMIEDILLFKMIDRWSVWQVITIFPFLEGKVDNKGHIFLRFLLLPNSASKLSIKKKKKIQFVLMAEAVAVLLFLELITTCC